MFVFNSGFSCYLFIMGMYNIYLRGFFVCSKVRFKVEIFYFFIMIKYLFVCCEGSMVNYVLICCVIGFKVKM